MEEQEKLLWRSVGRGRGRGKFHRMTPADEPDNLNSVGLSFPLMRIKEDLKEDPNNLRITSAVNVEEHGTETPPQELPVPDAHAGVSDSTKEKVDEIEEFVLLPPPANKMEEAHEFRMDTQLSTLPLSVYFFCCVCGCPAGNDNYSCKRTGHPVCSLCFNELNLKSCPCIFLCEETGKNMLCASKLRKFKCKFREFMFLNVKVNCMFHEEGCQVTGPWEEIKEHQKTCNFSCSKKVEK